MATIDESALTAAKIRDMPINAACRSRPRSGRR
jgi:hypothetical protein